MSDSDTRKELLAAQIRIDELTEDLATASAEIERLRGIYAATRDARRVMRALDRSQGRWRLSTAGYSTLDDWERENGLPDIDEAEEANDDDEA